MKTNENYFYELSERIRSWISNSIQEPQREWFQFGKKETVVVLSGPAQTVAPGEVSLQFLGYDLSSESEGTIQDSAPNDEVYLFRLPSRIHASYRLRFADSNFKESIRLFDCLCSSFFNKKTLEPFVPEAFQKTPKLYQRLVSTPAELSMKRAGLAQDGQTYEILLNYSGLYHNGEALRIEKRIRSRNLTINRNEEGVI